MGRSIYHPKSLSEQTWERTSQGGRAGGLVRSAAKKRAGPINGRLGGLVTSEAKAAAVRENGKLGGRPRMSDAERARKYKARLEKMRQKRQEAKKNINPYTGKPIKRKGGYTFYY
jgi:hypothetical protein